MDGGESRLQRQSFDEIDQMLNRSGGYDQLLRLHVIKKFGDKADNISERGRIFSYKK